VRGCGGLGVWVRDREVCCVGVGVGVGVAGKCVVCVDVYVVVCIISYYITLL